jgi:hypothetical protein
VGGVESNYRMVDELEITSIWIWLEELRKTTKHPFVMADILAEIGTEQLEEYEYGALPIYQPAI